VQEVFALTQKRQGLEADHSSPTAVEVRNEWGYSVHVYMYAVQRDNFTLNSMADTSWFFLDGMQRRSVVRYRRFGTNYLSHF